MSKLKLGIVSVFYNRGYMVDECVESLIKYKPENACIYLVDDGSTDDTLDKLSKYKDSDVLIISKKNTGFVDSIINTIHHIDADFIAIHGSGDIALNDRFNKQLAILSSKDDVVICGSLMELHYPGDSARKLQITGRPFYGNAVEEIKKRSVVTHGEVMFRKAAYIEVGGYRTFFKFAQDRDLWCRMSLLGNFQVVDEILYRKLCGVADSVSGTPSKTVIQRYLSDFAIWCHEEVLRGAGDPLERYGIHAAFLKPKRWALEKEFLKLYFKLLVKNDMQGADLVINEVKKESIYGIGTVCYICHKYFPSLMRSISIFCAKRLNKI